MPLFWHWRLGVGKAKKRGFSRKLNTQYSNITRQEAIDEVIRLNQNNENSDYLMSLFGLTEEELLEAGANYEDIK